MSITEWKFESSQTHMKQGIFATWRIHATLLHQSGLDHNKLTFKHHGQRETLTDSVVTKTRIAKELLA